jgi:hypothetical protein
MVSSGTTVIPVEPVTPPRDAEIVEVPGVPAEMFTPVNSVVPMLTTDGMELIQVAKGVTSSETPPE